MQFCDQCGTAFVESARFCTACGAPRREQASPAGIPAAPVAAAPVSASAPSGLSPAAAAFPAPSGLAAAAPAGSPASPSPAASAAGPPFPVWSGPASALPAPGPQSVSSTPRRPNGGIVAVLVGAGFAVGSILLYLWIDELFGNFWYTLNSNSMLQLLWLWLGRILPWAVAGGAAAIYLRPSKNRILAAAAILGAPTLLAAIIAMSSDYAVRADGWGPMALWFGRWYGDFIPLSPLAAAAALAGWLVLRGRSGPRLLVALLPLVAGVLLQAVYGALILAIPIYLAPVVGAAWLAAIGTNPRPAPAAIAPVVAGPAYQVLYTDQGERVLLPTVAAPTATRTNGTAVASLVLGLTGGWITLGLPAIITGHVARRQIRERGESGDGMAIAGLVFGYLTLAFDVIILVLIAANS